MAERITTDETIAREVVDFLFWDSRVDASNRSVTLDSGIVTLTGTVPSYSSRMAASEERLDRKVRNGVAAQLPDELKDFLLARSDHTDRYELTEFYNRVGARADLKYQDATERTVQVFSVMRQAIPEGEIQDILEDLPSEYEKLFEKELPSPGS